MDSFVLFNPHSLSPSLGLNTIKFGDKDVAKTFISLFSYLRDDPNLSGKRMIKSADHLTIKIS